MSEDRAGLIEKVKKLFAMAQRSKGNDGSSNEAEASAAMAKAQELLAKYNLDIRAIQDSAKRDEGKREKTKINRSAMYKWQQTFWKALCEANHCFHWVQEANEPRKEGKSRWVKRHVILGSEANVTIVQMMGEYLTDTIEQLIPYPNTERLSKSAISWREGCAERLVERIQEKAERMKKEGVKVDGVQSTALAVRDMVQAEYAANYDSAYGKGAYARKLQASADWEANRLEREAKWALETKKEEERLATLTPAQRRKEDERSDREDARWRQRCYRDQQREASRLDHSAYRAGRSKANDINLDDQLKSSASAGALKGNRS